MSAESDSEDDGYSCMELPTLIKQLRSVLDQYPDDGQILKELIQNAEDAEASEVKILYDGRQIRPQIDPKQLKKRKYLASLQAPALCVYNDAQFTEKDWKGIKMLHNSIKEEEPLKVGRFGLGFKSVFHVTDFPCIVSGDMILFLNPQERHSDKVCYMKKLFDLDRLTRQHLGEVLDGTFDFSSESSSYSGTLFWFPLRTKTSELSDNLYTDKKAMDLFEAFKVESPIILLFLKYIERIHLFERVSNNAQLLFTLQLSKNCLEKVKTEKEAFIKEVKELNGKIPRSSIEIRLILDVEMKDFRKDTVYAQEWLVINLYKGGDISNNLRDLNSDPSLSYCPYVGLAVPLGKQCQGHVFCFLPLPLENRSPTGLSIHVNGFFALSQNRRYVKWPTADQRQNQAHIDKSIEWNKCLVSEVLPEIYCSILNEVVQYCKTHDNPVDIQQQIYSLIPALEDLDINWTPLMKSVMQQICKIPFLFTPAKGGMWIQLQDSILIDSENISRGIICEVYTMYNENIVQLPTTLMSTLRDAHTSYIREISREGMSEILRSNNLYTSLPRKGKLAVLSYLQEFQYLRGLQLLPVADGTFTEFGTGDPVYFCENPDDIHIFPGLERRFIASNISSDLRGTLQGMATKGVKSLNVMSKERFPHLLQICLAQHFPTGNARLPSSSLTVKWLRQVWNYITQYGIDVRADLRNINILPDIDECGCGTLYNMNHTFIAQTVPMMESLPEHIGNALQKLGIIKLDNVIPDFVFNTLNVLGKVIQYPTQTGVLISLDNLQNSNIDSSVSGFNSLASRQEKQALADYLSNASSLSSGTKSVLKKLEMFLDTNNTDCDIETVNAISPKEPLPIPYPDRYIVYSNLARRLAVALGATQMTLRDICLKILKMIRSEPHPYTDDQVLLFMEFIMKNHKSYFHEQDVKILASEVPFLSSSDGIAQLRASDLFDKTSTLINLFLGEDRFPAPRHVQTHDLKTCLRLIGLKSDDDISQTDITVVAKRIEEIVTGGNLSDAALKVTSLVSFLETHSHRFHSSLSFDLQALKCIRCIHKKPQAYPTTLPFKGESSSPFVSPAEVFSARCLPIVGSVSTLAQEMPEIVEEFFKVRRLPPPCLVIEHLYNLTNCYESKEHHVYSGQLYNIYRYLSSSQLSSDEVKLMQNTRTVLVEDGFQFPKSVYLNRTDTDLDLRPYRQQLPSSLDQWRALLSDCGCHEEQSPDMLATVLGEIHEKHVILKNSQTKNTRDVKQDTKLVLQIIGILKDHPFTFTNLFLPIHQSNEDFLVLLPLKQCTYCNAEWLKDQTTDDEEREEDRIYFVHKDISESTAQQLGVCSLTERVMDDTDDFDMEYHQSEPLTRRLKNLLHNYTDGFSVPKELIQNADDAGATEVCFMYDERQNLDSRTSLMDERMAVLQGPAFWAYNNATFKDSDFENIKKLSGATKEEDLTKVGKFGLGFNAVYNMTDVPSFISRNSVVIFDPHETHLGKPGIKANLKTVKNQRMLKKMSGQFKPFEGLFGCHFKRDKGDDDICAGTLFRFPLRTEQQASVSEIKNLFYSRREMERFIQVFTEGCGNLLLFTQHVKSVRFFHLAANANPQNAETLLQVQKNVQSQSVASPSGYRLQEHSILSYTACEWEKLAQEKRTIQISEVSDVSVEMYDTDITREYGHSDGVKTVTWRSTWVTGVEKSATFALAKKLKGLLPLAAVAIPLKQNSGVPEGQTLDTCPSGFYKEGHFFCFLPLPVTIPFPVHINATFALTSDRRQLCTQTEDDKMLHEAEWNKVLYEDAISRAYIVALEDLLIDHASNMKHYYALWPTMHDGFEDLIPSIYRRICGEKNKVFVGIDNDKITKVPFESVRFLDPSIRCNVNVGDIAYRATFHFWSSANENVVDMPQELLQCFSAAGLGRELHSRTISREEFFGKIFFPNINDIYWSKEERNRLTLYALESESKDIHELVRSTYCIPTKPSGNLKKPKQLIHPHRECAGMFSDEDECFPTDIFSNYQALDCLSRFGMIENNLPWESLLERARSVTVYCGNDIKAACKRSRHIICYLAKKEYQSFPLKETRRTDSCPEDIRNELKDTAFLPVLPRPSFWPLEWKVDTLFASPKQLFMPETVNLVGCSHLVLSSAALELPTVSTDIFVWIGVKQVDQVDIKTAANQLLCISKSMSTSNNPSSFRNMERICKDVYVFMNKKCEEPDTENRVLVQQYLEGEQIILTEKKMLRSDQVAFDLPVKISPYLYTADPNIQFYKSFLLTTGVKERFDLHDLLSVVATISDITGVGKLNEKNLQILGRITHHLLQMKDEIHNTPGLDIVLPDTDGMLYSAASLCINDCTWIDEEESMKFIHPFVSETVARWFGVKEKREADLVSHMSPFLSPFGQSEKLTSRLKRILSGYPCDSSIMKELLQNADDAKATELMFIKDFRRHASERLLCDEMKPLQGPALCVYNNSFFTEKDFKGIQNLGEGSKGLDPVQTGQYGVGFNAVYHLTDVPSFMTVGPGIEKTVCVLDPHVTYVPKATKKVPGVKIEHLSKLKSKYKDFFLGYLEDVVDLGNQGTLFRFPLRTRPMAETSMISTEEISQEHISRLLNNFQSEMFECLLFLHNVKKISIANINETGNLCIEYSVEVSMSDSDKIKQEGFIAHLNTQAEHIKDPSLRIGLDSVSPLQSQLCLQIKDSVERKQDWMVIHHSGFSKDKDIPEEIITAWEKGDIGLLPRGGIAVPLSSSRNVNEFKGKAYCILPLPIMTGLPVHVNGHFALDHEARRNLWHGGSDYRSVWNKHVIDTIIVPCYVLVMQELKVKSGSTKQEKEQHLISCLNLYNSYFPDSRSTKSEMWVDLVQSFYSDIVMKKRQLFGVVKPVNETFSEYSKAEKGQMLVKTHWVSVSSDKGFSGYLDQLESYFPAKQKQTVSTFRSASLSRPDISQAASKQPDIVKLQWLREILRDLNMKVIEAPQRIYEDIVSSGKEGKVRYLTPENVILFLKSHASNIPDKCSLGQLPKPLTETVLKGTNTMLFLTKFCCKADNFSSLLDALPLAVNNCLQLCCFTSCSPLFVTEFSDLLTGSPLLFLHRDMVKSYTKYVTMSPCLKEFDIESMAHLLPDTLKSHILQTGEEIMWANTTDAPNKHWISGFWHFLLEALDNSKINNIDFVRECLTGLKKWSLFPARDLGAETPLMLYPIRDSQLVLDMSTVAPEASVEALHGIVVPVLETDVFASTDEAVRNKITSLVSLMAGNWHNPGSVLKVLQTLDYSIRSKLSADHCEILLAYFCNNLKELETEMETHLIRDILKTFPFFESLQGELIKTETASKLYVIQNHRLIPKDGISALDAEQNIVILKRHYSCSKLYEYLDMQTLSESDLYTLIILPNFKHLPSSAKAIHMEYIRDELLKTFAGKFSTDQEGLLEQLRALHFIEIVDGSLHRASEFFSPRNYVFREMIDPKLFPPTPYDDPKWSRFLEYAGLNTTVPLNMFKTFAKDVENLGKSGINESVKRKSKVLVKYLEFNCQEFVKHNALWEIGSIRFLLPYVITEQWNGKELIAIFPQFQKGQYLVSYSESVSSCHCFCIWTSCSMFIDDADPLHWRRSVDDRRNIMSLLGIKDVPKDDELIEHLQNICTWLVEKQKESHVKRLSEIKSTVQMVMKSVYTHLKQSKESTLSAIQRKRMHMIFVPSENCMILPEEIVLNIPEYQTIKEYVHKVPQEFVEFVSVFQNLGAEKEPNANVYGKALQKLHSQTEGKRLHENELFVVKEALQFMFDCIKTEKMRKTETLNVSVLYLPDMDLVLRESKDLVLIDNQTLYQRVKSLNLPCFIGFKNLKLEDLHRDPVGNMKMLPKIYRLKTLSSLVVEKVSPECKEKASPASTEILHETSLISGIIRLINHEILMKSDCHFDSTEIKRIEEQFAYFQMFEVDTLNTVLQFDRQIVPGSCSKKNYFWEKERVGKILKVELYLDNKKGKTIRIKALVSVINLLTNGSIGDQIIHVGDLLEADPAEREAILDGLNIGAYNHTPNIIDASAFSPPGSIIPADMHWLLDNDFHLFDIGEYVGLELFDPDIDTDIELSNSDTEGPVYIYAIVKKILVCETSWMRGRYLLDVGNGRQEEYSATKLYKFWREKLNACREELNTCMDLVGVNVDTYSDNKFQQDLQTEDLNAVLKGIRDILKDAWTRTDVKDRDRIKKRLYLKWHPDKNPGREKFCTEVCKCIALYVQKLEKGLDIDDETHNSSGSQTSNRYEPTYSTFFDHMNTRSSRQKAEFKRYKQTHFQRTSGRSGSFGCYGSTSYNCHWSARNDAHPQPQEAKRWYRQAKLDMESAYDTLGLCRGFNWICFKCQQAAEKAIKAVWYGRNANFADNLRTHDITMSSSGLNNQRLSTLATELQAVVGNYNRMRYPDRLNFPRVPDDVYTEQHARQACQFAQDILSEVEEILQL